MGKRDAPAYDEARRAELASFLRARRAMLQPHDVGLAPVGGRRNTPGLRREEVALLSGVGLTWYTWLEQRRRITITGTVVDALARALRLGGEAHGHLRYLAGLATPETDEVPDVATPDLVRLLDTLMPAPACLFGPRFDFVAWNDAFAKIWLPESLPKERRNVLWLAFAEPRRRQTFVNWEERSRLLLSKFRAAAGRHPGDARFDELVTDLSEASVEFRSWWASYEVCDSINGPLQIRHRALGVVRFDVTELRVCGHPSLTLSVHMPVRPSDRGKVESLLSEKRAAHQRRGLEGRVSA